MMFDDFPELLEHVINYLTLGRPWDHPIDTTGPMQRQLLECMSLAEGAQVIVKGRFRGGFGTSWPHTCWFTNSVCVEGKWFATSVR
jgi:hypothetical protein